ncbi:MAG: hypothetical protein ACFFCS_29895, partial [Candidatus Hodarchaeota archaeon]
MSFIGMTDDLESLLKQVDSLETTGQVKVSLSLMTDYLGRKARSFLGELGYGHSNGKFSLLMERALEVLGNVVEDEESLCKVKNAKTWLQLVNQNLTSGYFDIALKYVKKLAGLVNGMLGNAGEIKQRQFSSLMQGMFMQILEPGRRLDQKFVELAKNMSIIPRDYHVPTLYDEEEIKKRKRSSQRFAMVWIVEAVLVAIWSLLGFPDSSYNLVACIIAGCVAFVLAKIQGTLSWNEKVVKLSEKFKPKKKAIFLVVYLLLITFIPIIEFKTDDTIMFDEQTVAFTLIAVFDARGDYYFQGFKYWQY